MHSLMLNIEENVYSTSL